MSIQFLPMPAIAYPQNAMINFQPMNQALQFYANNQLERGRFGLQQNADIREQDMHPLRMEREQVTTQGLRGQEFRAQDMHPLEREFRRAQIGQTGAQTASLTGEEARRRALHPYDETVRWYQANQPTINNTLMAPLMPPGMAPPTLPMMPPPQWTGQGGRPPSPGPMSTRVATGMPQDHNPTARPAIAYGMMGGPQVAGGPVMQGGGVTTTDPQALRQPMAPPQAGAPSVPPLLMGAAREEYIRELVGRGVLPRAQAAFMLRDEYAGAPDGVVTAGMAAANTAAQASVTAANNAQHLRSLEPLIDQAFVGNAASSRIAAGQFLQTMGFDPSAILQNRSLTASQVLQQGLAQLVGPGLAEFRPASNTDVTFVQSTLPNMSSSPEALRAGLRALTRIREREAMFQDGLSQALRTQRVPDRNAILRRVWEQIPDAPLLPNGQFAPTSAGTRGGTDLSNLPQIAPQDVQSAGVPGAQAAPPSQPPAPEANWNGLALTEAQKRTALQRIVANPSPENWAEFRRSFGDAAYHIARREASRMGLFGRPQTQAAQ